MGLWNYGIYKKLHRCRKYDNGVTFMSILGASEEKDEVQGLRSSKKRSLLCVNEHFKSEHNAEIRFFFARCAATLMMLIYHPH